MSLLDATQQAFARLAAGDGELWHIVWISLKVSLRLASNEILILRSSAADAAEQFRPGQELRVGWDSKDQQVIDLARP